MSDQENTQTPEWDGEADIDQSGQGAAASEQAAEAGGWEAEREKLLQDLTTAQENSLRAQAELQNVRRRAEQDVEKAHKFGQEKLIVDFLPVVDNLERALANINIEDASFKPIIEGIELTLKSFADTLARHKVEVVNPHGEPFDPQLHQAMTMVDSPDVEPNTVIDVFQKGYTLHGRLVRPAMVVVSKA
ncbi:MAG TPA: nucleotide exchange factor GrpE [Cellvibrionaceae bacterium]